MSRVNDLSGVSGDRWPSTKIVQRSVPSGMRFLTPVWRPVRLHARLAEKMGQGKEIQVCRKVRIVALHVSERPLPWLEPPEPRQNCVSHAYLEVAFGQAAGLVFHYTAATATAGLGALTGDLSHAEVAGIVMIRYG